jgi:Putative zinc-finger
MESRVTSFTAAGRAESGRGSQRLAPDMGSASGRTAVTKADEGVAPTPGGATHLGTHPNGSAGAGVAELTHEKVREQLSDYLDGGLGESARRRIDGHLAACPPCAAYVDTLRVTVRGVQQLPAVKAPAGAAARIVEQARREQQERDQTASGADG